MGSINQPTLWDFMVLGCGHLFGCTFGVLGKEGKRAFSTDRSSVGSSGILSDALLVSNSLFVLAIFMNLDYE